MATTRTQDFVERNVSDLKLAPISCPQNQATTVLPDTTGITFKDTESQNPTGYVTLTTDPNALNWVRYELAYIELYNAGPGVAWLAQGRTADNNTNWTAQIAVGQMYEIKTREFISIFAVGGACLIGRTMLRRLQAGDASGMAN